MNILIIKSLQKKIVKQKPKTITAICTHAILIEEAEKKMKKAGIQKIISTNTIEHKTNRIDLTNLLAKEL